MFNLTVPAFVFGTIISGILSAAFHLWRGGNWKLLILFVAFGWFGFWIAHFLGGVLGWYFLRIGPVNLGVAMAGNGIGLLFASWLTHGEGAKTTFTKQG
jgi:predicted permease